MKTIKLLSFIIILLGPVMSGSVWAAARSGGGHTNGSDHHVTGNQLAGGSQFSEGRPYASGIQVARRGGRGFRGGGRGFYGRRNFYNQRFYGRGFYGHGFGGYYRYGPGIGYGVPYYSPYYYGW